MFLLLFVFGLPYFTHAGVQLFVAYVSCADTESLSEGVQLQTTFFVCFFLWTRGEGEVGTVKPV